MKPRTFFVPLAALALAGLLAMSQGCTTLKAAANPLAADAHESTATAASVDKAGTLEEKRLERLQAETAYKKAKAEADAARATADGLIEGQPAK